ncbi:hypothetical protein NX86_01475 [Streptococcus phocae subsp. salmonis]|nr:hypothetical protein NX86_01475 [Streptococcus phocae subsp. salmonis]
MMVLSTETAKAADWVDETGKTHLYWSGWGDVRGFVSYDRKVEHDSVTWTVRFNRFKDQWVFPDFAVFLPTGVEAPDHIDILDEYRDGNTKYVYKPQTQWSYDWETQRDLFNKEWEKFPGWTGASRGYDQFTALKDRGGFSKVLVDNYGFFGSPEADRKLGHATTWTFKTKLKPGYEGKGDKLPFLAGIKQNHPLSKSWPSYIGELGINE